jgi:HPt (histidine-containing phosphotransfer) domain-containing protein
MDGSRSWPLKRIFAYLPAHALLVWFLHSINVFSRLEATMANVPGNVDWVAELIPNVADQLDPYVVATDEVDDELVGVFIDEIRRLTAELQEGVRAADTEMIRMAAHSIKGMGGTIGLPEISVLGLEIEKRAKANRPQEAGPLVDALAEWLTTLG